MGRLAWSQLRFRTTRLLALLAGMMLATTAFTVLTAAARTSQLRTVGTVSANFAPAYDILVRPRNSRTALEARTDTVQPNFLSGLYGGITMSQWHQIGAIPGVDVAAPVAMVGYTQLATSFTYDLPARAYAAPGRQLYRIATTWVSDGGTSRIKQPASYVYVTPRPLQVTSSGATRELLPGGAHADVCQAENANPGGNPFAPETQATASDCSSKVNGAGSGSGYTRSANPGYTVFWKVPVLIAAVDPVAEAKLDGLNRALVSGSYLAENSRNAASVDLDDTFPVLAASSTVIGETAVTQLQQLPTPRGPALMNAHWLTGEAAVAGRTLATKQTTAQPAYRELLKEISHKPGQAAVWGYWTVGPTNYRPAAHGALTPLLVRNPASTFSTPEVSGIAVSVDNQDNQYRPITNHAPTSGLFTGTIGTPRLVGIFNPAKVKSFDSLSAVPLGAYDPTAAAPANAASSKALRGSDLLPDQNLGGYVSQPADLITTLTALPALQNAGVYGTSLDTDDPISVIRVRVAGVTGPNSVSLERIKEVAQQIEVRTHLDVDIVAGSSPAPTTVDLPAGKYGQPALTLTEDWVKKGVERGGVTTWAGDPGAEQADIVLTDTITAMALATGTWTLSQARRQGHVTFRRTSDDGRRWAAALGICL